MRVLTAVIAGLAGLLALEGLSRLAVAKRTAVLVRRVVRTSDDLTVELPGTVALLGLLQGRVAHVRARCRTLSLPGLEVRDVAMAMTDLRLDARLGIQAGSGVLTGRLPAEEVLAMAGVPGALQLRDGRMTVRWPATGIGARLRLRPVLIGRRIRLAPTPLSITLPPLPSGTTLVAVDAHDDALSVTASLDLPTLLNAM